MLLSDRVVAQARRRPDAVAICQWQDSMRYGDLVGAAGALATRLRHRGVGAEHRVGVSCRRSLELPVAALGVLLAGGAYVPLDPSHPRRRLQTIVADAGITTVVVDDVGRQLFEGANLDLVGVDLTESSTPPALPLPDEAAAYVMYTSGSAGRPKGVTVAHRAVVAFADAVAECFPLDDTTRAGSFAAFGFDVSLLDLFVPLTCGASVQLIPDIDRADPRRLERFLAAHHVTWGFIPPALLPLLDPQRLPDLRDVITAGEPPGPEQAGRWSGPGRRFHNWYGPTETTVCVVGTELSGTWDRPLPIGLPLGRSTAYVLDEHLRPRPPGVRGQLYVGGPQVARGYLGRPALTAECFVPDSFSDEPGARMYATGDQVVREPDGRLTFTTRLDRQVKIHGQRVEIGEVEAAVRSHPDVLHAVVDAPPERQELVAYLTPRSAPDIATLRRYCADRIPAYMVPTRAVRCEELPLNASGKVDIGALRATASSRSVQATRPLTVDERRIAQHWTDVLAVASPDPDTSFFDVGGSSLAAMRLAAAVRAEFGRDVAVGDVLSAPTIAGLASRVVNAAPVADDLLTTDNPPAMSPTQMRLWLVEQLAPNTPAHNIALAERLRGPIVVAALRAALRAVLDKHDVLRYRIQQTGAAPHVDIAPPGDVPLMIEDLRDHPPDDHDRAVAALLESEAAAPFDLATGPLCRARLLCLAPDEHVLALTVHHMAFDGWSQTVFAQDLSRAYQAALTGGTATLEPPLARFADYVAWLSRRQHTRSDEQLAWWSKHLADSSCVLDLPRDDPRPPVQQYRGARRSTEVDAPTAAAVRALARRLDTTPAMIVLTAFGELLRRLAGREDVIVGVPHADRRDVAFAELVGPCLHILPLQLRATQDETFVGLVRRTIDEMTAAIAHCDVPLERIVEACNVPRDLSRSPLVQVLFNAYDFTSAHLGLPGCTAETVSPGLPGSLFDLTLYVSDDGEQLTLQIVYNPELYSSARVDAMTDSLICLLGQASTHPDRAARTGRLAPSGGMVAALEARSPRWDGPGVVERVRSRATSSPDAVAIAGVGGPLTYRDVERIRRVVGDALRSADLDDGCTVAVLASRHAWLPAMLLGVASAGARWAVLDPATPPALLTRQAEAAAVRALLCCPDVDAPEVLAHLPRLTAHAEWSPSAPALPDLSSRGYVSFTSGTTGTPKPVITPERPLAHFLDWYVTTFGIHSDDRFALLAGLSHDPLLRDAFAPLVVGAQLVVPDRERVRDPAWLLDWLRREEITVLHLTPQLASLLPAAGDGQRLESLRLIGLGGDQLTAGVVAHLRALAPAARILNFYGTTETPQAHAFHEVDRHRTGTLIDASQPIPIGQGIRGSRILVLDGSDRLAGVGELGQVVVRSRHLATGYGDAELTAERFGAYPGDDDDRLYRTGDLGRYQPDGSVVIAGRRDDQVKIRGFRVELGEIVTALSDHPMVRAAAVILDDGPANGGEPVLRGYVVPTQPGLAAGDLLDHARARLPEYSVPAEVHVIPAMPLTANGKIDRARLPRPALRPGDALRAGPTSPTEQVIADVWRAVLRTQRVGPDDTFFEIGGNSLAIVAVRSLLSERLGRDIRLLDLFRFPSIRMLARHLDGGTASLGAQRAARRVAARRTRRRPLERHSQPDIVDPVREQRRWDQP